MSQKLSQKVSIGVIKYLIDPLTRERITISDQDNDGVTGFKENEGEKIFLGLIELGSGRGEKKSGLISTIEHCNLIISVSPFVIDSISFN
jgi:hypothetical protein